MNSNKLLSDINKATQETMRKHKVDYILKYNGVHLGAVSFKDQVMPIVECEDDFFIPDRKTYRSYRRKNVFRSGNVVYKTGEIDSSSSYHISKSDCGHLALVAKSNLNLMHEVSESLEHSDFIHPVLFMVHDISNELLYIAQPKALTLLEAVAGKNANRSLSTHKLEQAAESFYRALENKGMVFVPRLKSNGRTDLGDIVLTKGEDRKLAIKVTDHPKIVSKDQAEIDNYQSLTRVISDLFYAVRHR